MKAGRWQEGHTALQQQLLIAHEQDDLPLLAQLYSRCADLAEAEQDPGAACFYLTHALVFALDCGSPQHQQLEERLRRYGCL